MKTDLQAAPQAMAPLTAFLRRARARIDSRTLGIPRRPRRRSAGLCRDDVASLCNMSEVWYARFETGRAKISLAALARVANVLNLSAAERCELLALVHPEWGPALGELAALAYGSIE